MIIHLIKISDSPTRNFFSEKYKISYQSLPLELVEIRKIDSIEANELMEIFNSLHLNYQFNNDKSSPHILLLEGPQILLSKFNSDRLDSLKIIKLLKQSLLNYLSGNRPKYKIGEKDFDFNKAYLMGILNVTPDSFSDGGKFFNTNDAVEYALEMIDNGVDIIDIGGESTQPGSDFISVEEEKKRVLPVVEKLLAIKSDLIISVDTTKSQIASCALDLGAAIINDVSAMTLDENMIEICGQKNASVILMHMKGTPKTMQNNPTYNEVISDIYDHLHERINEVELNGIKNIIIDPGIGFGKSVEHNFLILKRLKEFSTLGYPILIGLSRKSFIGKTLNLDISERDFPTAILETISLINCARIIRTHNIKNGRVIVDLINKII